MVENGERVALLIGASTFEDAKLVRLPEVADEVPALAEVLAEVLADPELGGFRVETLIDASCWELQVAMARFCASRSIEDVVVVY